MMVKSTSSDPLEPCKEIRVRSYVFVQVTIWLKGGHYDYCGNRLCLVKSIDFSNNKLSGVIPNEVTSLVGLVSLNLSKNLLKGQVPVSIGNMRLLESLDFSKNQLSGEIPSSITSLNFLGTLDFSYNNLKGKIPTGTQMQSFEASSFVGNGLCGPPLPNCTTHGGTHDHTDGNEEGSDHGIDWSLLSKVLGYIVGMCGFLGPLLYNRSWRIAYFRWIDTVWFKLRYWY
ncbi:hypothetical protein L6164_016943 [Bauhinia variegata]|uniref:Uncharacterized protein n=1 Tax=Bauhinia variegata TaxID=167791 RepID=A0ACB9NBD4_BAUVA|nr:hypothetical protein L6164_016943 [Bauhinia variegata]